MYGYQFLSDQVSSYTFSYGNGTKLKPWEKKSAMKEEEETNMPTLEDPVCESSKQMHFIEHRKSRSTTAGALCSWAETVLGFQEMKWSYWHKDVHAIC